jgi:hypothetical protein
VTGQWEVWVGNVVILRTDDADEAAFVAALFDGDVCHRCDPAPELEVDYVVRDAAGNVVEVALKDGRRIYTEPLE